MKTTGYELCDLLRKTADETQNHERALIMTWAADEIEQLIGEVKLLEKEKSRRVQHENTSLLADLKCALDYIADSLDDEDPMGRDLIVDPLRDKYFSQPNVKHIRR